MKTRTADRPPGCFMHEPVDGENAIAEIVDALGGKTDDTWRRGIESLVRKLFRDADPSDADAAPFIRLTINYYLRPNDQFPPGLCRRCGAELGDTPETCPECGADGSRAGG